MHIPSDVNFSMALSVMLLRVESSKDDLELSKAAHAMGQQGAGGCWTATEPLEAQAPEGAGLVRHWSASLRNKHYTRVK